MLAFSGSEQFQQLGVADALSCTTDTPIQLSGMISFSLPLMRTYYYSNKIDCSVFLE